MTEKAPAIRTMLFYTLSILSGALFSMIVGHIDTADYIIELWTLWIVEIPFIVFWAAYTRKYGLKTSLRLALLSIVITYALFLPEHSLTVAVYVKVALMGIILGDTNFFPGSFSRRLVVVAFPGVMLALIFGLPVILRGVPADIIERFRSEALEMYKAFMSEDQAINSANNAVDMFKGIFQAGFSVMVLGSLLYAWLSFHACRFLMARMGGTFDELPPFHLFRLPFHAVWVFLASFAALLAEYEPVFPIALNLLVIMVVLYLVQGLSVVMYHMNRLSLGRLPRILFWLFFFFTIVFSGIFLIGIGLVDNWFNLRAISSNNDITENDEVT